ncbi:MAG: hypothetical protein ACREOW_09025 [Thermodesulfobacteriota bacterium]
MRVEALTPLLLSDALHFNFVKVEKEAGEKISAPSVPSWLQTDDTGGEQGQFEALT